MYLKVKELFVEMNKDIAKKYCKGSAVLLVLYI